MAFLGSGFPPHELGERERVTQSVDLFWRYREGSMAIVGFKFIAGIEAPVLGNSARGVIIGGVIIGGGCSRGTL